MKWITFKLLLFCLFLALSGCSGCHKNPTSGIPIIPVYSPIDKQPDWSPDGNTIAYTHIPQGEPMDSIAKYGTSQIWLLDLSSRSKRYLTSGFSPRWSPDGSKLIIYKGICLPYIIKASGDSLTPAPVSSNLCVVTWLPDGRRFGVTGSPPPPDTIPGVFVMDTDGSNLRRILTGPPVAGIGLAEWAKGSYEIVYQKGTGLPHSESQLWVVDSNGGSIKQLTNDPERTDRNPRWSPEGGTIAFYGFNPTGTSVQIWRINRDGSNLKQLTMEGGEDPSWAPGGGQIVYCRINYSIDPSKDPRNGRLWTMNSDGSNQQQLTFP